MPAAWGWRPMHQERPCSFDEVNRCCHICAMPHPCNLSVGGCPFVLCSTRLISPPTMSGLTLASLSVCTLMHFSACLILHHTTSESGGTYDRTVTSSRSGTRMVAYKAGASGIKLLIVCYPGYQVVFDHHACHQQCSAAPQQPTGQHCNSSGHLFRDPTTSVAPPSPACPTGTC